MADRKARIDKQILLFGMSLGPENYYQLVRVLAPKRQSIWSSLRSNSEKLVNRFNCRAGGLQDQIDPDGHDLIGLHNSILRTRKSGKGQQRKSSVGLGMSAPGGKADLNFGRLDVCS